MPGFEQLTGYTGWNGLYGPVGLRRGRLFVLYIYSSPNNKKYDILPESHEVVPNGGHLVYHLGVERVGHIDWWEADAHVEQVQQVVVVCSACGHDDHVLTDL